MQRILFIIAGLVFIVGCSEVYEPDVDEVDPFLSIEGFISTKPGPQYVYIMRSKSYNDRPYFVGEAGAIVYVTDSLGKHFNYENMGNGVYRADLTEGNGIEIGYTYILQIITRDGTIFRSTPQKVVQSPEIANLYCEFGRQTILTENTYGDAFEQEFEGINLMIETNGILPSDNYYLYHYTGYEEHHSFIQYELTEYQIFRHRHLSGKYSNIIHTVNADEFGDFEVKNEKLLFIVTNDMTNYDPIVPDTFTVNGTRWEGLLFRLEQLSLSSDAYTFYRDAEQQLAAEGHLFDPTFTQITGNITCVSDPPKRVVGVFYAADISVRYAYFYINYRNHTYTQEIDSFPELWLDTCSWGRPEDWIVPPF
jgi:hypothetical protein